MELGLIWLQVVAMLLQSFNFVADDPNYQLRFKQTLTIKPKDFKMRAVLRNNMTPTKLEHALLSTSTVAAPGPDRPRTPLPPAVGEKGIAKGGKPMSIFYGSNTGTCEALAQRLASDAPTHGFEVNVVEALDTINEKVPTDQPITIITASYEGAPPDNASHFVAWLEGLQGDEMKDVSYSVFGCGMAPKL